MSCQRNSESGAGAGIKNGITRLANKAGNMFGAIQAGYAKTMDVYNEQVIRTVAPATNRLLAKVDRPASTAAAVTARMVTSKMFPFVVSAAVMFRPGFDSRINKIVLVPTDRETRDAISGALSAGMEAKNAIEKFVVRPSKTLTGVVVGATREGKGTRLTLKRGEKELASASFVKVPKITRFLNGVDLVGSHRLGQDVISSRGEIVRAGLKPGEAAAFKRKAVTNLATAVIREATIEQVRKAGEAARGQAGLLLEDGRGRGRGQTGDNERQKRLVKAGANFAVDMAFGQTNSNVYWHWGTSVFKTLQGETRTVTHLQSLAIPAQHYYFDRELSRPEVAEIVTGLKQAHHVASYVGGIHPIESLMPVWGGCKKGLITARLYYPPPPTEWVKRENNGELPNKSG
ncbi:MAG: hypothetical protein U0401_32315 [Anaerolineae bacterium]